MNLRTTALIGLDTHSSFFLKRCSPLKHHMGIGSLARSSYFVGQRGYGPKEERWIDPNLSKGPIWSLRQIDKDNTSFWFYSGMPPDSILSTRILDRRFLWFHFQNTYPFGKKRHLKECIGYARFLIENHVPELFFAFSFYYNEYESWYKYLVDFIKQKDEKGITELKNRFRDKSIIYDLLKTEIYPYDITTALKFQEYHTKHGNVKLWDEKEIDYYYFLTSSKEKVRVPEGLGYFEISSKLRSMYLEDEENH